MATDLSFSIKMQIAQQGLETFDDLIAKLKETGQDTQELEQESGKLKEALLDLAKQHALIDQFASLKREVVASEKAYKDATAQVAKLAKEMREAGTPTKQQALALEKAKTEARQAKAAFQENQKALETMRREMASAGISTKNLAASYASVRKAQSEVIAQTEKLSNTLRARLEGAAGSARVLADKLQAAKNQVLAFVAAMKLVSIGRNLIDLGSQWESLNARLRLVTESQDEFAQVQKELFDLSQRTGTSLNANADLYIKIANSIKALGGSTQDAIDFTETFSKTLIMSGASAAEASSATLQLGQALASGVLRGDEFNSIMEAAPGLMSQLAEGLGVAKGELRGLAQEGQLTAERVVGAILKQQQAVNEAFDSMPNTVARAMEKVNNEWLRIIGTQNEQIGVTKNIAEGLDSLANNLETIVSLAALVGNAITAAFSSAGYVVTTMFSNMVNGLNTLTFGAIDSLNNLATYMEDLKGSIADNIRGDFNDVKNILNQASSDIEASSNKIATSTAKAGEEAAKMGDEVSKAGDKAQEGGFKFEELNTTTAKFGKVLKKAGIDLSEFTSGVDSEFSTLVETANQLAVSFEGNDQIFERLAQKMVASATTTQELEAAENSLTTALNNNRVSRQFYLKTLQAIEAKKKELALASSELGQAFAQLGLDIRTLSTSAGLEFTRMADAFQVVSQSAEVSAETILKAGDTLLSNARNTAELTRALNELNQAQKNHQLTEEQTTSLYARVLESLGSVTQEERKRIVSQSELAKAAVEYNATQVESLKLDISQATTKQELAAIQQRLSTLTAKGLITDKEAAKIRGELRDRERELADAMKNRAAEQEAVNNTIDQGTASLKRNTEAAKESTATYISWDLALKQRFISVSKAAGDMFDRWRKELAKTLLTSLDWWSYLTRAQELTQEAIDNATKSYNRLMGAIKGGKLDIQELNAQAATANSRFKILGEQRLATLIRAIDDAKRKIQSLNESATATLASMREELANFEGDRAAVERIQHQQKVLDLEKQIAKAKAAGATEAVTKLKEALSIENDLFERRLKRIESERRAREEEKKAQEESLAREKKIQDMAVSNQSSPKIDTNAGNNSYRNPFKDGYPTQGVTPPVQPVKTVSIVLRPPQGQAKTIQVKEGQEQDLLDVLNQLGLRAS